MEENGGMSIVLRKARDAPRAQDRSCDVCFCICICICTVFAFVLLLLLLILLLLLYVLIYYNCFFVVVIVRFWYFPIYCFDSFTFLFLSCTPIMVMSTPIMYCSWLLSFKDPRPVWEMCSPLSPFQVCVFQHPEILATQATQITLSCVGSEEHQWNWNSEPLYHKQHQLPWQLWH